MKRYWISLILLVTPVLAFGPREALGYRSPELGPARAALEAAHQRAGAVNLGLSSQFSAQRSDGSNTYNAALGWQWDFSKRLEVLQAINRAEREVRRVEREGIKNALLAHAASWNAQARLNGSERRLEAARARLAEAERKLVLGAISATQREEVALALRQAELGTRQAQVALGNAQAEAARYGLSGAAEASLVSFAAPEVAPEKTPTYQEARLALELAQSRLDQAYRTLWPEVNFSAGYYGNDAQFQAGASWSGVGPGANVSVGSPLPWPTNPFTGEPIQVDQNTWKLTLGAKITLAPEAFAALSGLQAERDGAGLRLSRTLDEVKLRLSQSRSEVGGALESLSLAQARLDLSKKQLSISEAKAKAGSASEIEVLEAQAATLESEAALAQAWQTYVTAVAAYLDLSDGVWAVL